MKSHKNSEFTKTQICDLKMGTDLFYGLKKSNKKEMENQINYYSSDSESEEEYEKCDHEYTAKLYGDITCLSCGLQMEDLKQFVPEEGFEYRVISQKKTDDLRFS